MAAVETINQSPQELSPDEEAVLIEQLHQKAAEWISDATHILIGAGAGMSVDAGLNYLDSNIFKQHFPVPYQLVGYKGWESPAAQWGYLAPFVSWSRFNLPPTKPYADLLEIVKKKEHFVLTSNVDGMFVLNNFDESKVYTTQGDFQYIQCLKPCTRQVWPSRPIVEAVLPFVDKDKQEITKPEMIPKCPNCGGKVMMNVRGGDWFIEDHYMPQQKRMQDFLADARKPGNKLVLLEIGVGFNTPTVIRHRFEIITYQSMQKDLPCRFIRLNLDHPEVPDEIVDRSLPLPGKTAESLARLKALIYANSTSAK